MRPGPRNVIFPILHGLIFSFCFAACGENQKAATEDEFFGDFTLDYDAASDATLIEATLRERDTLGKSRKLPDDAKLWLGQSELRLIETPLASGRHYLYTAHIPSSNEGGHSLELSWKRSEGDVCVVALERPRPIEVAVDASRASLQRGQAYPVSYRGDALASDEQAVYNLEYRLTESDTWAKLAEVREKPSNSPSHASFTPEQTAQIPNSGLLQLRVSRVRILTHNDCPPNPGERTTERYISRPYAF